MSNQSVLGLHGLPIELTDPSLALTGDRLGTGGRLGLRSGEIHGVGPLSDAQP